MAPTPMLNNSLIFVAPHAKSNTTVTSLSNELEKVEMNLIKVRIHQSKLHEINCNSTFTENFEKLFEPQRSG
jgi:hypothetical protein